MEDRAETEPVRGLQPTPPHESWSRGWGLERGAGAGWGSAQFLPWLRVLVSRTGLGRCERPRVHTPGRLIARGISGPASPPGVCEDPGPPAHRTHSSRLVHASLLSSFWAALFLFFTCSV